MWRRRHGIAIMCIFLWLCSPKKKSYKAWVWDQRCSQCKKLQVASLSQKTTNIWRRAPVAQTTCSFNSQFSHQAWLQTRSSLIQRAFKRGPIHQQYQKNLRKQAKKNKKTQWISSETIHSACICGFLVELQGCLDMNILRAALQPAPRLIPTRHLHPPQRKNTLLYYHSFLS